MEAYSKDTYFMNILKQVEAETRILQSKEHIQHGTTTVYEHCVQVAYESYLFAKEHHCSIKGASWKPGRQRRSLNIRHIHTRKD